MSNVIFNPLKKVGKYLDFLTPKNVAFYFIPLYLTGVIFYFNIDSIPSVVLNFLPEIISVIGLIMVLKSFSERKYVKLSWLLIVFSHYCIALSVAYNEHFDFSQNIIYLSGITISGIVGFICLHLLRKKEPEHSDLNEYYGHVAKYPMLSFVFLLATLGVMGFPITPSFIGEDLIFSHIHDHQYMLGFFIALTFVLGGISVVRNYARLFLGPYCKPDQSNPKKSS